MTDLTEIFGEPIHVYSREDAVRDGVLVDLLTVHGLTDGRVEAVVREHFAPVTNWRAHPVCFTHALWAIVARAVEHPWCANSFASVLRNVFLQSRSAVVRAARRVQDGAPTGCEWFAVVITGAGPRRLHTVKVAVEIAPDGNAWLTYMLEGED